MPVRVPVLFSIGFRLVSRKSQVLGPVLSESARENARRQANSGHRFYSMLTTLYCGRTKKSVKSTESVLMGPKVGAPGNSVGTIRGPGPELELALGHGHSVGSVPLLGCRCARVMLTWVGMDAAP